MPQIGKPQTSNNLWLRHRELGINFPLGHEDRFQKTLYSSVQPITSWEHGENLSNAVHGGVFNLEYSPDGSLLLAACEKKSILMFDPLCRRLIHAINNAHEDSVNCVRFLDQRMFATCSDDSTVALWDARNLKQRIRTLHGHSNWVKNIEYSPSDGLLLSSGFDGSIYTWDINSFTESSFFHTRVFHTNGLMRTTLSPDATKMLICTTSGYLIVIHNLNLSTLFQDLAGFKPNMYRLMQVSQTTIPVAANSTHLFSHKRNRNRVEFLTDFPDGDDAEVISSVQVHPQGWCALSRNITYGEKSEWSCIHDIQERNLLDAQENVKENDDSASQFNELVVEDFEDAPPPQPSRSGITTSFVIDRANRTRLVQAVSNMTSNSFISTDSVRPARPSRTSVWQEWSSQGNSRPHRCLRSGGSTVRTNFGMVRISSNVDASNSAVNSSRLYGSSHEERVRDEGGEAGHLRDEREIHAAQEHNTQRATSQFHDLRRRNNIIDDDNFSTANVELHVSTTDVWEALVAIREARLGRARDRDLYSTGENRDWLSRSNSGVSVNMSRSSHTVVIIGDRTRPQSQNRQNRRTMYAIPRNHKIHQNIPRLTHYIEEPNVGSGYIKEICFSADGRLICSPFGYGVRLLAFSSECQELSNCVPPANESVQLHELATSVSHSDIVVSTKFSPRHCLLVSGCLSGKIVWYQPVI